MAIVYALIAPQQSNAQSNAADQQNVAAEIAQVQAAAARARFEAARAQAEVHRAELEAARAQAAQGQVLVLPRDRDEQVRREETMVFTGLMVALIAVTVVLLPVARAFGRRLEGGRRAAGMDAETAAQLQRIEHTVEAMAVEIERLSEGQRFTTKLLAKTADAESLIPRG